MAGRAVGRNANEYINKKKPQIIIYPLLLYGDCCVGVFQNRVVYSYGEKINSVSWALVQPKS